MPGFVLVEQAEGLATVTVSRPEKLNALNAETVQEIGDVFHTLARDEGVRAVVLTGAGEKAFVAGADIAELSRMGPVGGVAVSRQGQDAFRFIELMRKPVIAAVNGFALGGGLELALACHLRIASENARFGLPEVKLGIIPGYGGTQRLPRLVGKGLANQLVLSGEMINAAEAARIGLVNEVVPAGELMPRCEAIAQKIIANSPIAIQYCLEAVNKGMEMPLREGLFLEASLFGVCASTEDKKEGTKAFLEKRAAQFTGK